jgi:flagellum-specific peptidoglycan hydrolase FlgJ
LIKNASDYWSQDETFQKGADAVNAGLTAASKLAPGAMKYASDKYSQMAGSVTEAYNSLTGDRKTKFFAVLNAARMAGDPHPELVAAQWALESGWGKSESGRYNFFGVKAVGNQPGSLHWTHEFLNGKKVKIQDRFRDYSSLEEGIADRVAFIKRNPRYTKAGYYAAKTPRQAAQTLQNATYATDPNYAVVISNVLRGIGIDADAPSGSAASVPAGAIAKTPAIDGKSVDTKTVAKNAEKAATQADKASGNKATTTAVQTASSNTGSTKTPATVDADDVGVKPTTAAVVQDAVKPKPIVPAVAANDTPRVGMEDEMPVARVEPITVAASPVAAEPSSGLSKASVAVESVDEFVVSDKQAREAAVAQAERERSEAMNNTSLGIDGAVRLLREQLKVNLSMDRSLTTISETLKRMERQQGGSGSSSGSSQSGGGAAPAASKRQTVAQSDPPPVSLSKRA